MSRTLANYLISIEARQRSGALINRKRIRNLELYLKGFSAGGTVNCAVRVTDELQGRLLRIGFTPEIADGETVLPSALGPISRFNAEGRFYPQRDQPKETAYRTIQWSWTERHGDKRVEQTDFKEIPYQRYPRVFVEPPAIELMLRRDGEGHQLVAAPAILYTEEHHARLLHTINLLLELFGTCELLNAELTAAAPPPTARRLNWKILPQGRTPWEQLRTALEPLINRARPGNRPFLEHRLHTLHSFRPDFQVLGEAGFGGYVIFGFSSRKLFVCESAVYGNATYVFEQDWERLSQLSKAEILNGSLEKARIIHVLSWTRRLRALLGATGDNPDAAPAPGSDAPPEHPANGASSVPEIKSRAATTIITTMTKPKPGDG
jgi:hypothetical protein